MADDPRDIAFNPAAPAGERYDASAELGRAHRATASDLIPPADIQRVVDFIEEGFQAQDLAKATSNVLRFPSRGQPEPARGMRSVALDHLQIQAHGTYWERPTALSFASLRQIVDQTPVLSSVLLTRLRQVNRFCGVSEDGGPGFEIRHVDRKHQITDTEAESAKLLQSFFAHCGWEANPRKRRLLRRDNFTQLMMKLVRDSLTMDSCPLETEFKRDRAKGIDGLYAVDGETIRLCTDEGYEGDDSIFAVQVVQGRICTAYTRDQLIYEPRNPRTDVRFCGYGQSETELLIRVVTGWLNAMNLNIAGFDQNSIPKGMMNIIGEYGADEKAAFRRYWNAMVRGVNNAWSLPVMFSDTPESKAEFVKFGVEYNEMYFSKWMTFLTSIVCAIYGMAPDEINFESFAAARSSLSGNDTAEKLADSKDKGLRPLLSYFEGILSDYVVADFSDKFCFRWVGLDPADQAQEWEAKKLILSLDELRAEKGYDPYPVKELGDAPLNPTLVGAWQQQKMPPPGQDFGGQAPEGQDFGTPDEEAAPGGPQGDEQDQQGGGQQGGGQQDQGGGGDFGQAQGGGDFGQPQQDDRNGMAKAMRIWSVG